MGKKSCALSNIFSPILMSMGESGGSQDLIRNDAGFRSGVYIYRGILVSEVLGKVFDLKYKDIDLLMMGLKG
jgi:alanine dehydrogenase